MNVLIGCEFSGVVREAFRVRGHNAWSVDIIPSDDDSQYHICGNILDWLYRRWDLAIFFPPCTYLSVSGARHWSKRIRQQNDALIFVRMLLAADIPCIALENPVGRISTAIRKPDQIIQPWYFGEDASKKTCLWLKNLSLLRPTYMLRKFRYGNQLPSGQVSNAGRGPWQTWGRQRSITYKLVGAAMAEQWG